MECKNQKECIRKSENWMKNQDKYCPIGEREFEEFYKRYKKGKAIIEFDQHFSKRCLERSVTDSNFKESLEFGWVIERNKTVGQISIVILCYVGKYHRPIHVVFNIVAKNKWIAVTTYTPLSQPWKWSEDMTRICFCSDEMGCE